MKMNYRDTGVNVEAGDALVAWLKDSQRRPQAHQERILSGVGGFAALFRGGFPQMESPCLVSATDGVGTKVKLAAQFSRYGEVAQDLVAMCVNDLICTGATPLFFLDYYAVGKLEASSAQAFLAGVQKACDESGCALIGGETAEMPDVYREGEFDCAGFAVGVVDEPKVLGPHRVKTGDRLLGLKSSGFHSNGYSLLRRVFAADLAEWQDVLLQPTRLFPRLVKEVREHLGDDLHAIAHITGGGWDNLPRILPLGTLAHLNPWPVPEPFRIVRERAGLSWEELLTTLNCGIGMVLVVAPQAAGQARQRLGDLGEEPIDLGEVLAKSSEGPADTDEPGWAMDWEALEERNRDREDRLHER